jgi:hypothetical protein
MTSIAGSSTIQWMTSPTVTSASLPVVMQMGVPMPRSRATTNPHAVPPGDRCQAGLRRRPRLAGLREPGGEHDRRLHPARAQLVQRFAGQCGGNGHDGGVRHLGQIRHRRKCRQPLDLAAVGVHRHDPALEPTLQHIRDRTPTNARRIA